VAEHIGLELRNVAAIIPLKKCEICGDPAEILATEADKPFALADSAGWPSPPRSNLADGRTMDIQLAQLR
jgi:hypothetical protein